MSHLHLSADDLLSTTRAVRRRLDFTRPVERAVLEECVELAVQAPSGQNRQRWEFVIVTDPERRRGLADVYARGLRELRREQAPAPDAAFTRGEFGVHITEKTYDGLQYLNEHLDRVPALVIPCIHGRTEGASVVEQANTWGSILPAVWSFMLAARERGLGTAWTTLSLHFEREIAAFLGIPYEAVMQAAMIPVAYTIGTDFRPGPRVPTAEVVHWDRW